MQMQFNLHFFDIQWDLTFYVYWVLALDLLRTVLLVGFFFSLSSSLDILDINKPLSAPIYLQNSIRCAHVDCKDFYLILYVLSSLE